MTDEATTEATTAEPMALRAYARRRGVSPAAVVKAIDDGRLEASVGRTDTGARFIADPVLADREWAENTDRTRGPGAVQRRELAREGEAAVDDVGDEDEAEEVDAGRPTMKLGEAAALEKEWGAKLKALDYRQRTGELVDAKEIRAKLAERITRTRTHLLGLPSKLKAARPQLTREDLTTLDRLIREALEELAENEAPGVEV